MSAFVLVKGRCVECSKFLIGPICTTCVQLACGLCQKDHERDHKIGNERSTP